MTLHTTIVGCGAVAQRLYRKPLQQLAKQGILKIVSLVDPVAEHSEVLGAFFPGASRYRGLGEALSRSSDLTLILSPAHLHCEQAIEALGHGSHVLCEKPMATTAEDCARMNVAAANAKRVLAVGMIRRFYPAFAQLKQILAEGRLGTLESFDYREGHKFEWDVTTPAAFRPRHAGGTGVLFDIGPHVLDHLTWTFGELRVLGYSDDAFGGIESNMSMDVAAPGCRGSIHLSWDSPQANELRVFGSSGEAVLRIDRFDHLALRTRSTYVPQAITVSYAADLALPAQSSVVVRSYPQAVYGQLVQVARAITLGEPPAVDGESGTRTVSALATALSMARPLAVPWLNPCEKAAFGRLHWTNAS